MGKFSLFDFFTYFLPFSLILLCGLYLTFHSRFFQIGGLLKAFPLILKSFKSRKEKAEEFSSFKAFSTSLSSTVGTGNIVGVASAVVLGGAGAVFWMWVAAFFGMIIKYFEITLAAIHSENGEGPISYIKKALPKSLNFIVSIFAVFLLFSSFFSGNILQVNVFVTSLEVKNETQIFISLLFGFAVFLSLSKGVKSIGALCEKLTPFMTFLYIFVSFCVILKNIDYLPYCFKMIIKGAFRPSAVTAGAVGQITKVIFIGTSRGLFSNEAGLGTAAVAHSNASDKESKVQGIFGIFEVFCDTVVICTLTALTILCSRVNINYGSDSGALLVESALSVSFGGFSKIILSLLLCVFSFSSVIGWALYGKVAFSHIKPNWDTSLFFKIYPAFCVLGGILKPSLIWEISAFLNAALLICNIPAIIYFSDSINFSKGRKNNVFKKNRKSNRKIK